MKRIQSTGWLVACLGVAGTVSLWQSRPTTVEAHCQVPCGIFDDAARVVQLREDATTIEKAITNINSLAGKHDGAAFNQAVRWVTTKDDHANHVMTTVSEYFLAQRVKPVADGAEGYGAYVKSLADHHAVLVAAMKAKQNADPKTVEDLRMAIDGIAPYYAK